MLHRVPDFYDNFHCIADKCTDSCCIGWEIDVDETTQKEYNSVKGSFARQLRENISDGHFILKEGNRCPFLNQNGLCDIYLNLGESALGDICREHPRFVEVYGDIKEQGVGLCCEEAVRLLLESNSCCLKFVERKINEQEDEMSNDVREVRDAIFVERENLFTILSQEEIPLNERLKMALEYGASAQGIEAPDKTATDLSREEILHQWIDVLGRGESFGPAWDIAYKRIKECCKPTPDIFSDRDGALIVSYLLFRYYAKSLFDGDSFGKVQFAIFFWLIQKEYGAILAGENPKVDARIAAIKLLSKQVEYSEEVMEILANEFENNNFFYISAFNKMLD